MNYFEDYFVTLLWAFLIGSVIMIYVLRFFQLVDETPATVIADARLDEFSPILTK